MKRVKSKAAKRSIGKYEGINSAQILELEAKALELEISNQQEFSVVLEKGCRVLDKLERFFDSTNQTQTPLFTSQATMVEQRLKVMGKL